MKFFISQPMKGKSTETVINERKALVEKLTSLGHEVIDSINVNYENLDIKNKAAYSIGNAIMQLSKADAVYFMDGWDEARGCKVEYHICNAYNIPTYFSHSKLC